jgi:hypothetical protein
MNLVNRWLFNTFSICMLLITGVRAWASPFSGTAPFTEKPSSHETAAGEV